MALRFPVGVEQLQTIGGGIMTTTARILVVDDEINIRGALVTLLEKKGLPGARRGNGRGGAGATGSGPGGVGHHRPQDAGDRAAWNFFAGSKRNGRIRKSWS